VAGCVRRLCAMDRTPSSAGPPRSIDAAGARYRKRILERRCVRVTVPQRSPAVGAYRFAPASLSVAHRTIRAVCARSWGTAPAHRKGIDREKRTGLSSFDIVGGET
jgi:hypothetical protein